MAEMTAAHAIERAEHALRTGQPNLACTYMRRATALVAADQEAARRAILRARMNRASPLGLVEIALEQITEAVTEAAAPILQMLGITTQTGYALAGPSKGGN